MYIYIYVHIYISLEDLPRVGPGSLVELRIRKREVRQSSGQAPAGRHRLMGTFGEGALATAAFGGQGSRQDCRGWCGNLGLNSKKEGWTTKGHQAIIRGWNPSLQAPRQPPSQSLHSQPGQTEQRQFQGSMHAK